jgi:hypothetical protein
MSAKGGKWESAHSFATIRAPDLVRTRLPRLRFPAVPPNTSRQDAPFSLHQHPNRSVPGNPLILEFFTLAIGILFDIHMKPAKKNQRGFGLGATPN